MRRVLAAIPAALMAAGASASPAELPVDLELVLAVDVSDSVDAEEAALQRRGYVEAFRNPDVVEAIRSGPLGRIALTYVEWAGPEHQRVLIGWRLVGDGDSAAALAAELAAAPRARSSATSISAAIAFAAGQFDGNGYDGARRVIDISGDGDNNTGPPVTEARDAAVALGITINGLPILSEGAMPWDVPAEGLDVYYDREVIGGPGAFTVAARNFGDFEAAVLGKLVREIAAAPLPRLAGAWDHPRHRPAARMPVP
ncbi:MAG TPA: DUF1194 domain-containing protein [Alphaproteobacteria bacterium]|nr:DUF1194 domain-containing protein [Alphaproteobacteria bacterium]